MKEVLLKNKFVWIENINSFSGRHKLKGDKSVGSCLWYPDYFEESQKIYTALPGERVYHFLNMENLVGFSTICGECKCDKYKTKAQKRVAYLESIARGIKCKTGDLSRIVTVKLCGYKTVNEAFRLDKIIASKPALKEFITGEYKNEFEYLITELSRGSSLIRLSFSFWLFFISFRGSAI